MRKKIPYLLFMFCIILILLPQTAYAKEKDAEENDIYDSLQESIHKNWEDGFADLEATDEIEIKGPLSERLLRGIARYPYNA